MKKTAHVIEASLLSCTMHPLFYFRSFNVSTRERINEVASDNQYNILILYQLPITIRESIEVILCLART